MLCWQHRVTSRQLGRLLIMPIERIDESTLNGAEEHDPVMLLTLNADNSVSWEELEIKVILSACCS